MGGVRGADVVQIRAKLSQSALALPEPRSRPWPATPLQDHRAQAAGPAPAPQVCATAWWQGSARGGLCERADAAPLWDRPASLEAAARDLASAPGLHAVAGPLDPNGTPLSGAQLARLHTWLRLPQALPPAPPTGTAVPDRTWHAAARRPVHHGIAIAQRRSSDLGRAKAYILTFGVLAVAIGVTSAVSVMLPGSGG